MRLSSLPAVFLLAFSLTGSGQEFPLAGSGQKNTAHKVSGSRDVSALEKIAKSDPGKMGEPSLEHSGKEMRSAAYARLGALSTVESLAAARRVEQFVKSNVPARKSFKLGTITHPMWHFSDSDVSKPLISVKVKDGTTYALITGLFLGDANDMFLLASSNPQVNQWNGPYLLPPKIYRGISHLRLEEESPGHLIFSFQQHQPGRRNLMEGQLTPPKSAPALGPQTWHISVEEVERDSDADGLTDIEEQRLGTDAMKADSDGDGIPDGLDPCPLYAATTPETEDSKILQKVFFAQFALTNSRYLILVGPSSKPIQVYGYRGTVLFLSKEQEAKWKKDHPEGGIYLNWKITEKTADAATVELNDWEGPLSASGVTVRLKKHGGEWFVVKIEPGWIS
jgi:hypothetical protein